VQRKSFGFWVKLKQKSVHIFFLFLYSASPNIMGSVATNPKSKSGAQVQGTKRPSSSLPPNPLPGQHNTSGLGLSAVSGQTGFSKKSQPQPQPQIPPQPHYQQLHQQQHQHQLQQHQLQQLQQPQHQQPRHKSPEILPLQPPQGHSVPSISKKTYLLISLQWG